MGDGNTTQSGYSGDKKKSKMADPFTIGSTIASIGAELLGGDNSSEEQLNFEHEKILIELLKEEAMRQAENRRLEAIVPFVQERLMNRLDPTSGPFNPIMARSRQRTYQGAEPGSVSMTPGGQSATPEQLNELQPDFAKFQAIREQARASVAGIRPENFQTQSVLPMLNEFEATRGKYISNDNGANEAREEGIIGRMATEGTMPTGRDPSSWFDSSAAWSPGCRSSGWSGPGDG
jgi:hypothetical protein